MAAAGVHPNLMPLAFAGMDIAGLDPSSPLVPARGRPAGARLRWQRGVPRPVPGSLRLAFTTLTHPGQYSPGTAVAGWLPRGFLSTEPLKDIVRRLVPQGWALHPSFWAVACDYRTGKRVVFGREGAPSADLADAVAASCAIPGFYHPVEIGGRLYIDGGVNSLSNLDLLAGDGLDTVLCLNPTAVQERRRGGRGRIHRALMRGLVDEDRAVTAAGTRVHLYLPSDADLAQMGWNLMSVRNLQAVIETARASMLTALEDEELAPLLRDLTRAAAPPPRSPIDWLRRLITRRRPRRRVDELPQPAKAEGGA
jgi:NTE family protein